MQQTVKFMIKYHEKNMHLSLTHYTNLKDTPGIPNRVWDREFDACRSADPLYNSVSDSDKDNVIVTSNKLEPLVFYMEDNYIKCCKTNKYICCFGKSKYGNRQCCGGANFFLSHNKELATKFNTELVNDLLSKKKEESLFWCKSRCYPRGGYPGDGVMLGSTGGRLNEEGPVISYHNPNQPQNWRHLIKKNMVRLEIVE